MAKRKQKVEEIVSNDTFDKQFLLLEDFLKIIRVVENSESLIFKFEEEEVNVDYSNIAKKNLKILSKKNKLLKNINYKDNKIEVQGNRYDCLTLFCIKKSYYLPITKSDGSQIILTGGK